MKATLRFKFFYFKYLLIPFLFSLHSLSYSQNYKGKDGAEAYNTSGNYILNRYTSLVGSANAAALSFTVSDINELNGTYSFTNSVNPYASNSLAVGDLVMIIKMQGADIATTDDAGYGAITNYQNTGDYELRTVFNVSGNTIYICKGLTNSYAQSGRSRVQVVRIPRLTSLTVAAGVTITGLTWGGSSGGIVAIETSGNISLNGKISADTLGFHGGVDNKNASSDANNINSIYRTTVSTNSAGKGESIAGNASDYDALLNGAYGRGAPANGGGGGNGHNNGGGGGSNAGSNGSLTPWNGTGIKNNTTGAWTNAWNLEAAGFATDVSVGAGRGGYSFTYLDLDALTVGPGNALWNGNKRYNDGGFGGRPLNYNTNSRLFLGGGGGSGDGNNDFSGDGGNGGGIVYLLSGGNISGTGTVTANSEDGYNTTGTNVDGAGGSGGGGAIVAMANGSITGISMKANGGKGGDQLYLTNESDGPGGGGSGGYIATTTTSVSRQVNGGANGNTYSTQITEFLPNGATRGAAGNVTSKTYTDVVSCSAAGNILPLKLISFTAVLQDAKVMLKWVTADQINSNYFEIERSTDGMVFTTIALVFAKEYSAGELNYTYNDKSFPAAKAAIYYRLKMVDNDNSYTYSGTRVVSITDPVSNDSLIIYPNPAISDMNITLPAAWQNNTVRFYMYDGAGKLIMSTVKAGAGLSEVIRVQNLSKGYYIVKAAMGNEMLQQKMIKN